ncbi:unnamed protein product [Miscanthus lutarioriparius]|uniref:Uncharacterized protein n=1 Tax=Miscanthus lutarioriparius TaxID=422564 RepID=A0A811R5B5_9POAL|nr:unnamed protein product [Miscanthus lutarioriparius]
MAAGGCCGPAEGRPEQRLAEEARGGARTGGAPGMGDCGRPGGAAPRLRSSAAKGTGARCWRDWTPRPADMARGAAQRNRRVTRAGTRGKTAAWSYGGSGAGLRSGNGGWPWRALARGQQREKEGMESHARPRNSCTLAGEASSVRRSGEVLHSSGEHARGREPRNTGAPGHDGGPRQRGKERDGVVGLGRGSGAGRGAAWCCARRGTKGAARARVANQRRPGTRCACALRPGDGELELERLLTAAEKGSVREREATQAGDRQRQRQSREIRRQTETGTDRVAAEKRKEREQSVKCTVREDRVA